jgi:hypothetical protein
VCMPQEDAIPWKQLFGIFNLLNAQAWHELNCNVSRSRAWARIVGHACNLSSRLFPALGRPPLNLGVGQKLPYSRNRPGLCMLPESCRCCDVPPLTVGDSPHHSRA